MLPDLIGKRVTLRPPRHSDLVAFFYYASKPTVGPSAGWLPHQNLDESKRTLDLFIREQNIFAITINPHDVMVGTIGFHNYQNDHVFGEGCELGFVLDDTYWNQGYMTEAVKIVIDYVFSILKFDYLMISHADFNIASKRVIEKNGFKFQYKTHKTFLENPDISEVWYYKMTKEDYFHDEERTIN
ncbi:MAG TPA: GNAT family N-acetyltransferase [Acholeplasma sp.]|nr:GNAT family N-acetyltransferase [Acholeplasma sp.]